MSPFLQMRLWWLRASEVQRAGSSIAVVIVVVMFAWVLVPTGVDDDSDLATTGTQPGLSADSSVPDAEGSVSAGDEGETGTIESDGTTAPAAGSTPGAGATGSTTRTSGVGGRTEEGSGQQAEPDSEAAQAPACPPVPDGMSGVDDDSALVAMGILNLAGPIGNAAVGVDSPEDVKELAELIADDINANGGAGCKKLELKFYETNPLSQDQQRSTCIEMAEDEPLLALDVGAFVYPQSAYTCLPQQQIPVIEIGPILASESKFAPYLATPAANTSRMMRTFVHGLQSQGYFDPSQGFEKLGLLMDQCAPEVNDVLVKELRSIGIEGGDKVSTYTFECPNGFASPTEMLQAASRFRSAGVTHVIPLTGGGSLKPFTDAAEGQRFRPMYGLSDYQGVNSTATTNQGPNRENFANAITITNSRLGGPTTPDIPPSAGTERCAAFVEQIGADPDRIFTGRIFGAVCALLWMTEAAMDNAAQLSREQVLPGLFQAGPLDMAYPLDKAEFSPDKFFGGDTWWPAKYDKDCDCWKVIDSARQPSR